MSRVNKRSGDVDFLSIAEGGTGATTMAAFRANNGILEKNSSKAVILGVGGAFPSNAVFTDDVAGKAILVGSFESIPGQELTFTISNYDSFTNYNVATADGTITILNDVIKFTSTSNASGNVAFTVNGAEYTVAVSSLNPTRPVIQASALKTGANTARITVQGSGFQSAANATMVSMQVEISLNDMFDTAVGNSNAGVNPVIDVVGSSFVYVRARFIDSAARQSTWSTTVILNIATAPLSIATPTITVKANKASTGAKFNITGSTFTESSGKTHKSTVWQVSGNSSFTDIISNTTDTVNLINKTVTVTEVKTSYYVRVKYVSSSDAESGWSSVFSVEYAVLTNGVAASENGMLVDTPATANYRLGSSVAISDDGQTAVVGISNYQGGSGRVLIFKKTGNAWAIEKFINGTTITTYDAWDRPLSTIPQGFGADVEISGDGNTVCFNSFEADGLSAAYVKVLYRIYLKINNIWTEKYSIAYNYGSAYNMSIKSSYDGSRIIAKVGGRIVICTLKSDKTSYTVELPTQAYENGNESGGNVGVSGSGDRVFYSIYNQYPNNTNNICNRIRVVRMEETTQVLETSLYPDVANNNTTFGLLFTVNKTGQYLAAYDSKDSSIYVFVRNGTTWTKQSKFTAPAITIPTAGVCKLMAMNEDGSVIALGVPSTNKVIYYSYNGVSWAQDTVVTASIAGDIGFGTMVDMTPDGTNLISGAPLHNSSAGAAFVFS